MSSLLLAQLELEDTIQEKVRQRFPALNPALVVKTIMDRNFERSRQTAKILMAMRPEVVRVLFRGGKQDG